jgi:hypothetical protein
VAVDEYSVQPGTKCGVILESFELAPGLQYSILVKVISAVGISCQTAAESHRLAVYRFQKLPKEIPVHFP